MATLTLPMASLRSRLDLPPAVIEEYERQATAHGVTLDELLSSRLAETVDFTSLKPLYISDEKRRELEAVLGRNLNSPDELIKEVRRASTIRIDNVRVTLPQVVRSRLSSRHMDRTISYDEHVSRIVRKLLQEYVGR
jgi:hypothetical protein